MKMEVYTSHSSKRLLLLSRFSHVQLCEPIDGSPPGSPVPGILQARILERAAGSFSNACMHAKSLQSCPTLCDPTDGSPLGSPVHGILQARILEWVAIFFSLKETKGGQRVPAAFRKVKVKSLSRVRLFATPRTAAYQAPLSMGFSRQEYWSGVPLDLPEVLSSLTLSPCSALLPTQSALHPRVTPCLRTMWSISANQHASSLGGEWRKKFN